MKPTNPKILPILATALILIITLGTLGYSLGRGNITINPYTLTLQPPPKRRE